MSMRRANDIAKRRKLEDGSWKTEVQPCLNAVFSATARLYRVVNDKQPCCETYTIFQNMEMKYEHFSSSQEEYAAELWEVVKNPSRFKKHLMVVLETKETLKTDVISNPGYLAERSLSTERQMNCHLEEGTTERSVTLELSSNRFLAALEMTAGMKHGAGTELQRIGSESSATARFDRVAFNIAGGFKEITNGWVNCADGRLKLPGESNNLPIDAFKLPIVGLNCRWTPLNCQLLAQTANGRGNPALGVDQMRVSEKMDTMQEAVISNPGYSGERSLSTEQQMNCHLEEGTTERSVTTEQNSNRFLSSFGMTDMFEASATARFYRVVSDKPGIKMPHDTIVRQQRCKRDNNLNPFFLIEEHAMNCKQFSPPGEMPAGQRGAIVANKNKTSAYET